MARLYVVNCTGQNRIVNYRLDYTVDDQGRRTSERLVPFKSITIPARAQVPFGGDLHPLQISDIVGQLERTCGAVHVDDVRTAKKMGVVKMIWSQDKAVSFAVLKDVVDHNINRLSEQGAERRRTLALVADQQLTNLVDRPLPKLEMEFEQVEEDPDLPGRLTEGLRVNHKPAPQEAPKRRSSRRVA